MFNRLAHKNADRFMGSERATVRHFRTKSRQLHLLRTYQFRASSTDLAFLFSFGPVAKRLF
ncbi:hypothetical protein WK74_17290 [Burkholderia ubonensis]|nr:hypothetical protein WK74_17290 [Burkholderia ubonensis]